MRKVFMFAALVAASTAFVGCSSDEDLTQAPEIIEEVAPQGTPFTVKAFGAGDTRAVRYGEGGKEVKGGSGWIKELKIWGSQKDVGNNWLQSVVFSRTSADSDEWTPARNNSGNLVASTVNWPTTNTDKATTFYGITDGNIQTGEGNELFGVSPDFANGKITYSPETKTIPYQSDGILWNEYNDGWVQASDPAGSSLSDFAVVDNDKIGDLMVATAEKVQTADGSIPLPFSHTLCGLYISAKFCPVNQEWVTAAAHVKDIIIYGIRIHGLYTDGTYTFGSGWGSLKGQNGLYYYGFGHDSGDDNEFGLHGVTITAEATTTTPKIYPLVPSGTWLVVPQTVKGWDCEYHNDAPGGLPLVSHGAYVEILYAHGGTTEEEGCDIGLYPLPDMTFEAGHNYRLVIDVEKIRSPRIDNVKDDGDSGLDGKCDYIYKPQKSGGGTQP